MSLSFNAEHLAWQQRIARESLSSHKFYQFFDSQKSFPRKRSWSSTHSNGPPPSNPNLLRDSAFHHSPAKHTVISDSSPYARISSPSKPTYPELRVRKSMTLYRGPAEVRGKYAPPFPPDRQASGSVERVSRGSQRLERPATAGTLKRSLRVVDTGAQIDPTTPTRKSIVLEGTLRPRSANVTRGRARSRGLGETARPSGEAQAPDPPLDATVVPAPVEEHASSPVAETVQRVERVDTAMSFASSVTRVKYIEELERLLREERKRRILLEAKLQAS